MSNIPEEIEIELVGCVRFFKNDKKADGMLQCLLLSKSCLILYRDIYNTIYDTCVSQVNPWSQSLPSNTGKQGSVFETM